MAILLRRPDDTQLEELLARCRRLEPSYAEVGATADERLPAGYRHDRVAEVVGEGSDAWAASRRALERWSAHRFAGARLRPPEPALRTGETVLVVLAIGLVVAVAPCRIVYVTDEEDRFGFAYGTLPGHPERGEEAFHVSRDHSGRVTFEVRAFSRPAELLVRLGGPLGRAVQVRSTRRYLEGVRSYVATPDSR